MTYHVGTSIELMMISDVVNVEMCHELKIIGSDILVVMYQIVQLYGNIKISHYMTNGLLYGDNRSHEYFCRAYDSIF